MQKRPFGRTGHHSTTAIFGGAAFWHSSQEEADAVMKKVIAAGVNHIDVAPSYGRAETVLGPWMPKVRDQFFLGCKTMERSSRGAERELHESLERLQVDQFDLYQLHAVTNMTELDAATRSGGAIETLVQARDKGLTRFLGITGHGYEVPAVMLEALERFDFDSVLFPLNFIQYTNAAYRGTCEQLLHVCSERNVGTMIIKSIARGRWPDGVKRRTTWYEPFEEQEDIQRAVNFVLSQPVTGICTAGDTDILPRVLKACERFEPMNQEDQETLIEEGNQYESLFQPE